MLKLTFCKYHKNRNEITKQHVERYTPNLNHSYKSATKYNGSEIPWNISWTGENENEIFEIRMSVIFPSDSCTHPIAKYIWPFLVFDPCLLVFNLFIQEVYPLSFKMIHQKWENRKWHFFRCYWKALSC